jgi:hypothetical protein
MAKGPLVPQHVLAIPVTHKRSTLELSEGERAELRANIDGARRDSRTNPSAPLLRRVPRLACISVGPLPLHLHLRLRLHIRLHLGHPRVAGLRRCVEARGEQLLVFERFVGNSSFEHAHLQAVPLPPELAARAHGAFVQHGRNLGINFEAPRAPHASWMSVCVLSP